MEEAKFPCGGESGITIVSPGLFLFYLKEKEHENTPAQTRRQKSPICWFIPPADGCCAGCSQEASVPCSVDIPQNCFSVPQHGCWLLSRQLILETRWKPQCLLRTGPRSFLIISVVPSSVWEGTTQLMNQTKIIRTLFEAGCGDITALLT